MKLVGYSRHGRRDDGSILILCEELTVKMQGFEHTNATRNMALTSAIVKRVSGMPVKVCSSACDFVLASWSAWQTSEPSGPVDFSRRSVMIL